MNNSLKVAIVFVKVYLYKSNQILIFLLSFNCLLQANLPELSSINPIQFDEASQKLVAKGDALFQMDDLKIKADSIIYYKNYALLDAFGNINLASQNHRLLADSFLYNAEAESFSLNFIKYGYWPYYIAAKSGGGSLEKINFKDVDFYIGEPKAFSPNLRAKTFHLDNSLNDQIATLEKVQLRIGQVPIFYIPKMKYNLNRNYFSVSAKVGNSGEFGTYLETFSSVPLNESIKVGGTVNLYSSRGILYGPTVQYNHIGPNLSIQGAFDSGFIHDDGNLGVDFSNQPIQADRYYTIFQHKQKQDNTYTLTTQVINTSDTEVLRDFKETLFQRNFNPLNFVEAILPLGNFLVSAFSHFDVGDLSRVRERLPEIQLSYLPSQIWNSNFYHSASLNYSDYKESTLDTPYSTTTDYLDYEVLSLSYRIAESFKTKHFLLIPSIQYRGFHFDSKQSSIDSLRFLDERFEFIQYGLKLRSEYQAKYETTNSLWNVKGLKHLFIPELSIQKIHLAKGNPENTPLFRSFSISQPLTDISLSRDFESIKELFLTRLSFKNFFQTRYNDFAAKNLMELHFTADFYHQMDALEDSSVDTSKNAFWLEYALSPAPWLKLELASRLHSDDFSASENRIRLLLTSADRWSLNLSSYYIENIIDQLSLNYIYKLSEQSKLNTLLWGDIKERQITRFRLGLETISNSNWRTSYYLNYRKDSRKTDELSFNVGLDLISF